MLVPYSYTVNFGGSYFADGNYIGRIFTILFSSFTHIFPWNLSLCRQTFRVKMVKRCATIIYVNGLSVYNTYRLGKCQTAVQTVKNEPIKSYGF